MRNFSMTEARRVSPTCRPQPLRREHPASRALELMSEALSLIDACDGPAEAGCYLDQAIHQLREWADVHVC